MPLKECHVIDERLRFVARLLDGERMTTLCTEFGISRKTGYKNDRYKAHGAVGLTDRSRRPLRHANQLPAVIERLIVRLKKRYPTWAAARRELARTGERDSDRLAARRTPLARLTTCPPRLPGPRSPCTAPRGAA